MLYFLRVCVIMFLLSLTNLSSFFIPIEDLGDRMANNVGFVFTAIAFQFVINSYIPHISYLTLLDWYVLGIFIYMLMMTVQTCYVPTDEVTDEYFFYGFSVLIISYHLFFIVLVWRAGKRERRKLDPLWAYTDDADDNDTELSVIFVDNVPVPMDSKSNPGWKMQLYHNVVLRKPTLTMRAMSQLVTGNDVPVIGSGSATVPVPVPVPEPHSSPEASSSYQSVPIPPTEKIEEAADMTPEIKKEEMKKPLELSSEQPSEIEPLLHFERETQVQRQKVKCIVEQEPVSFTSGTMVLARRESTNIFEEAEVIEPGRKFTLVKYTKDQHIARVRISDTRHHA